MNKQDYFQELYILRYEYNSVRPKMILHSSDFVNGAPIRSKWRKAWIQAVEGMVEVGINRNVLFGNVAERLEFFQTYLENTFIHERDIYSEDILMANSLLDFVLEQNNE